MSKSFLTGVLAVATLATTLLATAWPTAAMARERSTQVTGPSGQTASRQVQRQQGDVNSTTTGPQGQTASRQVDRSASGATATVTGPGGQSASRVTTRKP